MNLALFDLDHTLLNGDSDYEWGRFMVDRGMVDGDEYEARNREFYGHYKAGTLDIDNYLEFALAPLARLPRRELDTLHLRFMEERVTPMWQTAAQELVDRHLAAGDLCAVVTATNAFITAPIVRQFRIPHLIATVPAQAEGEFTGAPRGTPAFQQGKILRVEAWLESLALCWESFEHSYFYSDSRNDLPLLAKVTDPIAVDPDTVLREHAERAGWPIISLHG